MADPKSSLKTDERLKPLWDKVVIQTAKAKDKSPGGILIPETVQASEKPQRGEVLAVGPGRIDDNGYRVPMSVKVGETVLFNRWAGQDIKDLGDDLLVMSEQDILGIIEKLTDA